VRISAAIGNLTGRALLIASFLAKRPSAPPTTQPCGRSFNRKKCWISRRGGSRHSRQTSQISIPGYKAKEVTFQEELASSMQLAATDASHLTAPSAASSMQLVETEGTIKPNGNSVDLEHEMSEMTKNGLQYVILAQFMNSAVKSLRYAITDGTKG
jgi:flagellar basal-body rod protein FlgB